jgi:hypothetical protein
MRGGRSGRPGPVARPATSRESSWPAPVCQCRSVELAVRAADRGTAVGQVEVLDVQRERFGGAAGGLIEQPPERLVAQRDVAAAEEPLERGVGQRARAVGGLAPAVELDALLAQQPVAGGVAEERPRPEPADPPVLPAHTRRARHGARRCRRRADGGGDRGCRPATLGHGGLGEERVDGRPEVSGGACRGECARLAHAEGRPLPHSAVRADGAVAGNGLFPATPSGVTKRQARSAEPRRSRRARRP